MNEYLQKKVEEFKKTAKYSNVHVIHKRSPNMDGLSKVIRNQADADQFMDDLEMAVKRAKLKGI